MTGSAEPEWLAVMARAIGAAEGLLGRKLRVDGAAMWDVERMVSRGIANADLGASKEGKTAGLGHWRLNPQN